MSDTKRGYRLTEEQEKYLNSLVCQRLSDEEANKELAKKFVNTTNPGIAGALSKGWNADKKDKMAFYIVKDPELDVPMFFFSLRCGEMHTPLDPEKLTSAMNSALMMLKEAYRVCPWPSYLPGGNITLMMKNWETLMMLLNIARDLEVADFAKNAIAEQLVDGKLTEKAWKTIWRRVLRALGNRISFDEDEKLDEKNIIRTKKSFAAVELEHFCAYDPVDWHRFGRKLSGEEKKKIKLKENPVAKKWYDAGMDAQSMAKAIFWKFVVPTIQDIRKHVGCEYIYLFAADNTGKRDGRLIQLYQDMGFDFRDDVYVTKPAYDFQCYFMCQEVTSLRKGKNEFFKNYNKPAEPAAV